MACSVSNLRAVVLWKVWKHVLHLTDCALAFCIRVSGYTSFRRAVNTYRLQLALCLLGALVAGAIALLLCPAKLSVTPPQRLRVIASYFAPLPILMIICWSLLGQLESERCECGLRGVDYSARGVAVRFLWRMSSGRRGGRR